MSHDDFAAAFVSVAVFLAFMLGRWLGARWARQEIAKSSAVFVKAAHAWISGQSNAGQWMDAQRAFRSAAGGAIDKELERDVTEVEV